MTDQPDHPGPSPDADEVAARWLEGLPQQSGMESSDLDEEGRRRLADLQLLHALLSHVHQRDDVARERRVQRLLAVLDSPELPGQNAVPVSPPHHRRRRFAWLASAAAIVFVAVLGWKLSPSTAYATVARALATADQDHDRTYRVVDEWNGPAPGRREALLYVRGTRFVVRPTRPLLPGLVLGGNGRESWAVWARGPVLVAEHPRGFFRLLLRGIVPAREQQAPSAPDRADLPFLYLRSLLERLLRSYHLEQLAPETLPGSDVRCQRIKASRNRESDGGAATVQLWVHPDTGVIHKMRIDLDEQERVITLDLQSEEALPEDWYEHARHHELNRPIRRWTAPKAKSDVPPENPEKP